MADVNKTEMRAAFEADYFGDLPADVQGRERSGGGYKYSVVQSAWSIWRAAWGAALASKDAASVLKDVRWRLDDIRNMLMKEGFNGDRIYGCDEWSTPTVNLATAIGVIDKALAAMKGDQP